MQKINTDWTLFGTTIGMAAFGVVILYSASSVIAELKFNSSWHFVLRQGMWMVPSLALMMLLKRTHYQKLQNSTVAFAAIGLVHEGPGAASRLDTEDWGIDCKKES